MKPYSVSIQMKATEKYFLVILFIIMLQGDSRICVCG